MMKYLPLVVSTAYLSVWIGRRCAGLVTLVSCLMHGRISETFSGIGVVGSMIDSDLGVC